MLPETLNVRELTELVAATTDPEIKERYERMLKIKTINQGLQPWQILKK